MYKQRLHVKKNLKKFLNSIKLFLLFSTEISSTKYRDVSYVQYRDVQVPRCPDTMYMYLTMLYPINDLNLNLNKSMIHFFLNYTRSPSFKSVEVVENEN